MFMVYNEYMSEAIIEAKKAYEIDEIPIGAIIVYKNRIIAKAYNMRNTIKNPLAHAEIIAINQAAKYLNDWRLEDCDMYVTLEPCPMCSGAIVQSRISKVIFGAKNPKSGCAGSILNILQENKLNHQVETIEGILEDECSNLIVEFFKEFRNKKVVDR